jgi:hypothetical protein
MAWEINPDTSAITMHKGDTGAYWVQLGLTSGESFEDGDVALYTVKQGDTVKISREYPLDDDEGAGNGRFLVSFRNSDTDTWAEGAYNTEIRVVLSPKRTSGKVVDGNTVRTITKSKSTITILGVLKEV